MQIDELPAGEQTRHPDLDMNQVVGHVKDRITAKL